MKIKTSDSIELFRILHELKLSFQYDSGCDDFLVSHAALTKDQCIALAKRLNSETALMPDPYTDQAKLVVMAGALKSGVVLRPHPGTDQAKLVAMGALNPVGQAFVF